MKKRAASAAFDTRVTDEDWKTELARSVTGGWCCDLSAGTNGRAHRDDCEGRTDYVSPTTTVTAMPLEGETTISLPGWPSEAM